MIDELVKAANAIDAAGIKAPDWHPKFKTLPKVTAKVPCVRIWLKSDGRIDDIESMPPENVANLRKYEPDAGKSLPGFNVYPLYRIVKDKEEAKKAAKDLAASMKKDDFSWEGHLACGEDFWDRTRSVLDQLKKRVLPGLKVICEKRLHPDETLSKFFNTFDKLDIKQFKNDYEEKAKAKVKNGNLPQSLVCYFVDEKKKEKEDADSNVPIPKISVFLDVRDYKDYPLAHERTMARLNELLLNTPRSESFKVLSCRNDSGDAYGLDTDDVNDKFAQVTLPILGVVTLRSQVTAVPAQARYGLCESQTFLVGSESRKRTKRALDWLASSERAGTTNGQAGDGEMLFAYPAKLPKDSIPQLTLMLGAQRDDVLAEQKFEKLTQSVIEQLKGTGENAKSNELEIFSLRKMDKARTKVVYYRNITVETLEAASRAWHAGFLNIPELNIREWSEARNEKGRPFTVLVEPQTLYPLKLHSILNTVWTLDKDGAKQSKVKIFEPSIGLSVLLDSPDTSMLAYVAERFLRHAQTYFVALCRAKGRNEIANLPAKNAYPGLLGLLLYKLGKVKETYMNESAYQLGRFLRVADEIHRLYCEIVRKKDIPPELCGSSLLTSMLEAPARTLDQLALRSSPYVKWARAFHDHEKAGLVHYWMRQWSQIADSLHKIEWPSRPTSEERAQVFLGYLSSFQKSETTSTESIEGEQK